MRIQYVNGEEATLTDAQRESLTRIVERFALAEPVTVYGMIGVDRAVMVEAGSMWLGVEPDGYTHS